MIEFVGIDIRQNGERKEEAKSRNKKEHVFIFPNKNRDVTQACFCSNASISVYL